MRLPAIVSKDPMIQLARLVDGPARKVRRTLEEQVDEPFRQAYAKIARRGLPSSAPKLIRTPPSRYASPLAW